MGEAENEKREEAMTAVQTRTTLITISWDKDEEQRVVHGFSRALAKHISKEFDTAEVRVQIFAPPERGNYYWTDEQILSAIRSFHFQHGRVPTSKEWDLPDETASRPAKRTVTRRFGSSWPNAIEEAGFPRPARGGDMSLLNQLFVNQMAEGRKE